MKRLKQELLSVIQEELENQEVQDHCTVNVSAYEGNYVVTINVDAGVLDEVDEVGLYSYLAESKFSSEDVLVEIVEGVSQDDALEDQSEEDEEYSGDAEETEERLFAQDGLSVRRVDDEDEVESEDDEYELDEDDEYIEDTPEAEYTATWEDLEAFEQEFGRDYGLDERDNW